MPAIADVYGVLAAFEGGKEMSALAADQISLGSQFKDQDYLADGCLEHELHQQDCFGSPCSL